MNLGELLKKKREEMNLNLQQLSDLLGISSSYLWRLETGQRKAPTIQMVKKIINALNLSDEEIKEAIGEEFIAMKESTLEDETDRLLKFISYLKTKKEINLNDTIEILNIIGDIVKNK